MICFFFQISFIPFIKPFAHDVGGGQTEQRKAQACGAIVLGSERGRRGLGAKAVWHLPMRRGFVVEVELIILIPLLPSEEITIVRRNFLGVKVIELVDGRLDFRNKRRRAKAGDGKPRAGGKPHPLIVIEVEGIENSVAQLCRVERLLFGDAALHKKVVQPLPAEIKPTLLDFKNEIRCAFENLARHRHTTGVDRELFAAEVGDSTVLAVNRRKRPPIGIEIVNTTAGGHVTEPRMSSAIVLALGSSSKHALGLRKVGADDGGGRRRAHGDGLR